MSDATTLTNVLAVLATTYLLHSTLLLAACWLLLRVLRVKSHFLVERMWKSAAVLGLATAGLQMAVGAWPMAEAEQPPSMRLAQAEPGEPQALKIQYPVLENEAGITSGVSDGVPTAGSSNFEPIDDPSVSSPEASGQSSHHAPRDESDQTVDSAIVESLSSWQTSEPSRFHHAERDGYFDATPVAADDSAAALMWADVLQAAWPWMTALVSIVLSGCVVAGGLLLAFQSLRLRTRFASARVLKDGAARRTLDRFLKRNRIRRCVRLLSSIRHTEPVTYGLFTWTIVLPKSTEEQLVPDELKALLAHEVAHLIRGDVWWLWIGRVLCTCLAFQPLNWLARRKWQQAAEYLCDDWAVDRGVRSISLARCLTQIAEWRFGQQPYEVGLAAGGTKATLVQRVERLVQDDRRADVWAKPLRRRLLTLGAAVAVVGLAGFAPRVALPLTAVNERDGRNVEAGSPADEDTMSDWHAFEEELLQLEADFERVNELLRGTGFQPVRTRGEVDRLEAYPTIQNLNRRAAALRARREHITRLLGKDSER